VYCEGKPPEKDRDEKKAVSFVEPGRNFFQRLKIIIYQGYLGVRAKEGFGFHGCVV
jgi:hypothetical protein